MNYNGIIGELIVVGADISKEVERLTNFTDDTCTQDMTDSEKLAYKLGVNNCISCLKSILLTGEYVNMPGLEISEEFTIKDYIKYLAKKQYNINGEGENK